MNFHIGESFHVGDRVVGLGTGRQGEVKEVDGQLIWVQFDDNEAVHGWHNKCLFAKVSPKVKEMAEYETWVEEAQRIVGGSRQEDYGDAEDMTAKIAAVWSQYLGVEVTPRQFCMLMVLLKVMRDSHKAKRDNPVDIHGYLLLLEKNERGAK